MLLTFCRLFASHKLIFFVSCSFFFSFETGLYHDDILNENDDVQEALRRLPQGVKDERNYRMNRAILLSMTKTVLPKDQWISFDEVSY